MITEPAREHSYLRVGRVDLGTCFLRELPPGEFVDRRHRDVREPQFSEASES